MCFPPLYFGAVMYNDNNYLMHYGVIGMKWGYRRYQNYDGSLKVAGKLRRAKDLEAKAASYKKAAKSMTNQDDLKKKTKLEVKSSKLSARAEKYKAQYEKKYAKTYVKDLNKALKEYNKIYDQTSGSITDNFVSGNILSPSTFSNAAGLVTSRLNYADLRNRAVSDIPRNTSFALEYTNKGYKLREKGSAATIGEENKPKLDIKTKGNSDKEKAASVVSSGIKNALDVYDTVKINSSDKAKTQPKASVNTNANQQNDTAYKASKIEKWLEPSIKQGKDKPNISSAEKIVKDVGDLAKGAGAIYGAVKVIKAARSESADSIKTDSSKKNTFDNGKSKVDTVINTIGSAVTVASAALSIASVGYGMYKKMKD